MRSNNCFCKMSATFFGRLNLYFWCCSRGGIREAACWQHSECAQQMHSTQKLSSMLRMRPWCMLAAQRMCTAGTDCILRKMSGEPVLLAAQRMSTAAATSGIVCHGTNGDMCWQHRECAQPPTCWRFCALKAAQRMCTAEANVRRYFRPKKF